MKKSRTIANLYCIFSLTLFFGGMTQSVYATCAEDEKQKYICGLNAPEDLFKIPNSPWIIASGMGSPGALFIINSESKSWEPLTIAYPEGNRGVDKAYKNCPGPLKAGEFSPHGINVRFNKKGPHTLYVVNHGGRESIEIFNLSVGTLEPTITWEGCVVMPEKTSPNSVVPLPHGSLAVTSIYDPTDKNLREKMLSGKNTGKILEWHAAGGWKTVPESELQGNNGIEISPDGRWYYVSGWFGRTLTKLSRNQEPVKKETVNLNFMPDNIRWNEEGHLILAGHGTTAAYFFKCAEQPAECSPDSTIIIVNPKTLEIHTLVEIPGNKEFSTASVAVQAKNDIFIGTFAKNRVAYFPINTNKALKRTKR